ncbi:hypothetical protein QBC39DRAFT_435288 [Podospora conica]|nr:hypothetical protein QBC39DRAFT_435288 [Schizothecium conicum]
MLFPLSPSAPCRPTAARLRRSCLSLPPHQIATVARSAVSHLSSAAWSRRCPLLALGTRECLAPALLQFRVQARAPVQAQAQVQIRGKKTRTTVKLRDLPQGPLGAPLEPLDDSVHEPAYPTVVMQARRNMQKFEDCVVLTRVGGFYELYFEHADEYGPLLNLKVAQKKTNAGPVSMAGFPFFQLDRFLKILVQDHHRHVAISEEFPNDASGKVKSGGLLHDRRVARIVTPGTLIDEKFMDPYANNYVMAIHLPPRPEQETEGHDAAGSAAGAVPVPDAEAVRRPTADTSSEIGLAWLDVSTGHFFTQPTSLSSLGSVLSRVSPREVVLDKQLESQQDRAILTLLEEEGHIVTYSPQGELETLSDWEPMLESEVPPEEADQFTENEIQAGSLLLHYVKDRLRGLSMKLQPPLRYDGLEVMKIDRNTMRSLEIKETVKDGMFKGSLLHAIRRTVTSGGARLLHQWLSAPSTSLEVIHARQDLVSCFLRDQDLCEGITTLLRRSHDSYRLVQKFALNRGDPDDLLSLASTIQATKDIVSHLRESLDSQDPSSRDSLAALLDRISLDEPLKLAKRIRKSIDEEGLDQRHQLEDSETGEMIALAQEVVKAEGTEADSALLPKVATTKRPPKPPSLRDHYAHDTDAWIMNPSASAALSRLHGDVATLRADKALLTDTLRARLNTPSLTLRWSPSLGHICHVKGKDAARRDPTTQHTLSSSRTTRSFHDPSWTALGERLDATHHLIRAEEQKVFSTLRALVLRSLVKLRRNASVLDALDIATSFSRLASTHSLVRPLLHAHPTSLATAILGGRHPTVEPSLPGRPFQRNDCLVGSPGHGRAWLITGPNMAGKSTFLRQNALIAILAQVGCYVPADHASLAVVDAVHTRVGSADDLSRGQSTFLVEMLETAAILRSATPRSLVIMDEVGRGTTPGDGEAVAFAALWHLVKVNRCRVLFATHFHGIADLVAERGMRVEDGGEVDVYCTDVEEDGEGGFVYVHKLRRGVNRNSHALKVARLAGLPGLAIEVARGVLEKRGEGGSSMGDGGGGDGAKGEV